MVAWSMDNPANSTARRLPAAPGNCFGNANQWGTVFSIDATTGTETVLYNFGSRPIAPMAESRGRRDHHGSGKLYGTTKTVARPATARSSSSPRNARKKCCIPSTTPATAVLPTPVLSWTALVISTVRHNWAAQTARRCLRGYAGPYLQPFSIPFVVKNPMLRRRHSGGGLVMDSSGNLYGTRNTVA